MVATIARCQIENLQPRYKAHLHYFKNSITFTSTFKNSIHTLYTQATNSQFIYARVPAIRTNLTVKYHTFFNPEQTKGQSQLMR